MTVVDQILASRIPMANHGVPAEQCKTLPVRVIRLKDVMRMTGLARSTIYKFVDEGIFPRAVPLGGRSIGWIEGEIVGWISERIAARDSQFKKAV